MYTSNLPSLAMLLFTMMIIYPDDIEGAYFDPTAVNNLHIRRNYIWHEVRAITKPTFDPFLSVRVTFIGEPAVDNGGLVENFYFSFDEDV